MTTAIPTGLLTRRRALALATALAAGVNLPIQPTAAESASESWTYAGNAARTGVYPGPGLDLDQDITEIWRISGGRFYVPAAVSDGTLFYAPSEVDPATNAMPPVIAVDARTGSEIWRHDPPATDSLTFFLGELAIAGGLLVATTNTGLLVRLDAASGEERWMFDLLAPTRWSSPAIVDGVLYTGDTTSVNAIKLGDTPEWIWKASLADGATSFVSGIVTVDGDYVIATSTRSFSDDHPDDKTTDIHVLNRADGTELYRHGQQSGGEIFQVAVHNGMLFSRIDGMRAQNGSAYVCRSIDGTAQWSIVATADTRTHPAVAGELVFCSTRGGLQSLDAATGETIWTTPPLSPFNGPLVVIDEVIYAGAKEAPAIYLISASDGTVLQSIDTGISGASVVGVTNDVLIARFGGSFRAFANSSGKA